MFDFQVHQFSILKHRFQHLFVTYLEQIFIPSLYIKEQDLSFHRTFEGFYFHYR